MEGADKSTKLWWMSPQVTPITKELNGVNKSIVKYLIRLKINYLVKLLKEDEKKLTKRNDNYVFTRFGTQAV